MRYRLALPLLVFLPLVLLAYTPSPSLADSSERTLAPPDTIFENLQVLPATMEHDALMNVMQTFTRVLGVRCNHCHVRTEEDWDFPSDANPHKNIAREMMIMTQTLNTELLAEVEGLHPADGFRVTCWTCHRGEAVPATAPPSPEDMMEDEDGDSHEEHDHGDHDHGEEGHEHGDHDHGDHDHDGHDQDGER